MSDGVEDVAALRVHLLNVRLEAPHRFYLGIQLARCDTGIKVLHEAASDVSPVTSAPQFLNSTYFFPVPRVKANPGEQPGSSLDFEGLECQFKVFVIPDSGRHGGEPQLYGYGRVSLTEQLMSHLAEGQVSDVSVDVLSPAHSAHALPSTANTSLGSGPPLSLTTPSATGRYALSPGISIHNNLIGSGSDALARGSLGLSLPQGPTVGASAGVLGQLAVRLMVIGGTGRAGPAAPNRLSPPPVQAPTAVPAARASTLIDSRGAPVGTPPRGSGGGSKCQLSILVVCGQNLPCVRKHKGMPRDTPPSAFVAVKTTRMAAAGLPAKVTTRAVARSQDPFWHELLVLELDEADVLESVFLAVVHRDNNKLLGKCSVLLGGLEVDRPYNVALPLQLPGKAPPGGTEEPTLFCTVALWAPASSDLCKLAAGTGTLAGLPAAESNRSTRLSLPGVNGTSTTDVITSTADVATATSPTDGPIGDRVGGASSRGEEADSSARGGVDGAGVARIVHRAQTRLQLACLDWRLHPAALARICGSLPAAIPSSQAALRDGHGNGGDALPGSDREASRGSTPAAQGPRVAPVADGGVAPAQGGGTSTPHDDRGVASPVGDQDKQAVGTDAIALQTEGAGVALGLGGSAAEDESPAAAPADETARRPPSQILMHAPGGGDEVPGIGAIDAADGAGGPSSARDGDIHAGEDGALETFAAAQMVSEAARTGYAPGVIVAVVWLLHPTGARLLHAKSKGESPQEGGRGASMVGTGDAVSGDRISQGEAMDGQLGGGDSGIPGAPSGSPAGLARLASRGRSGNNSANGTPRAAPAAHADMAAWVDALSTPPALFQDTIPPHRRVAGGGSAGLDRPMGGEGYDGHEVMSPGSATSMPGAVVPPQTQGVPRSDPALRLSSSSALPLVFPVFAPSPSGMVPLWPATGPNAGAPLAHAGKISGPTSSGGGEHTGPGADGVGGAPPPARAARIPLPAVWVDADELADDGTLMLVRLYSWAPSQGGSIPSGADPLVSRPTFPERDGHWEKENGDGTGIRAAAVATPPKARASGTVQGGCHVALVGSASVPLRDVRGAASGPWQTKLPLATSLTVRSSAAMAVDQVAQGGSGGTAHEAAGTSALVSLEPVVTETGVLTVAVQMGAWEGAGPRGQAPPGEGDDGSVGVHAGDGAGGTAMLVAAGIPQSSPLEPLTGGALEPITADAGSVDRDALSASMAIAAPAASPMLPEQQIQSDKAASSGQARGTAGMATPLVASWLRLLLGDLWAKQRALEALAGVAGTQGDVLSAEAAARMGALKERNQLLSEDVAQLRKLLEETQEALRTARAGGAVPDAGGKDLGRMGQEELLAHAQALARRCDGEQQRNRVLEGHLHKLHRANMGAVALENKYRELQEAHQAMSVATLAMQDDLARMHTVRETVHSQEKVISRLEQLLAASAGETRRLLAAEQELHYLRDANAHMMQMEPVRDRQEMDSLQAQVRDAHADNLQLQQEKMAALLRAEKAEARAVSAQNELLDATKRFAQEMSKLKIRLLEKDAQLMGGFNPITGITPSPALQVPANAAMIAGDLSPVAPSRVPLFQPRRSSFNSPSLDHPVSKAAEGGIPSGSPRLPHLGYTLPAVSSPGRRLSSAERGRSDDSVAPSGGMLTDPARKSLSKTLSSISVN